MFTRGRRVPLLTKRAANQASSLPLIIPRAALAALRSIWILLIHARAARDVLLLLLLRALILDDFIGSGVTCREHPTQLRIPQLGV